MRRLACALGLLLTCPIAAAQWQPAPEGGSVASVAIDPLNGDSVFVGGNRLFHSSDGAVTWARVALPTEGLQRRSVRAIAISRDEDGPIILETRPPLISRDRGTTWERLDLDGEIDELRSIQPGPAGSHVFYAHNDLSICRSDDDGESWKVMGTLADKDLDMVQMLVDRYDADTVSCMARWPRRNGRGSAFFVSRDGGTSFTETKLPDEYHFAADLSTDPDDGDLLYLCARPTGFGRSRMGGFFYSYDDGATWELLWDPEVSEPPAEATLHKLREIFPEMLASMPPFVRRRAVLRNEVACSADKPGRAVAAAWHRVQRSEDYGETWAESMTGLAARQVTRIVFDPNDPRAALCAAHTRVWYTADRGRTWISTTRAGHGYSYVEHVAFSPDGEHAFTVSSGRVFRGSRMGPYWEGVWSSRDQPRPLGLLFHTEDGDDGGRRSVVTIVGDKFLAESRDGGLTWDDAGKNNLRMRETRFGDRFAVHTVDGTPTCFAFARIPGTLWASTDRSRTWAPYGPTKEHKLQVWSMAADGTAWFIDQETKVHAVAADGAPRESVRTPSGLNLRSITCDPADADLVYIGTRDGRLIRTTDGGASYDLLEGGPTGEYINTLAVSPHDGSLWVGSQGRGVWILDNPKTHPGTPLDKTEE